LAYSGRKTRGYVLTTSGVWPAFGSITMKHERQTRFDQKLEIRAPECLTDAIDIAAGERLTSRSGYIRSALIDRLRADGIDPSKLAVVA
jgi:hypothetical protein